MQDVIAEFIRTRFRAAIGTKPFDAHTSLFTSGIVDSFGVLELIAFLEQQFGVDVDPARYELSDFDTAEKIERLVQQLVAGART
jgi:acyl carrier protein